MQSFSPKIGEILVVNFGLFLDIPIPEGTTKFQFRHKPEMPKKRLAVVLNNKISNGCLVVPISSTLIQDYITRGWHVELPEGLLTGTNWPETKRWCIAQQVQPVSMLRVSKVVHGQVFTLDHDTVERVQIAVIKAISAKNLID